MEALYTATARSSGGRNGHVATLDNQLKFDLSIPKSLGGPGLANTTNPEQLFACGYSACFGSALEYVAKQQKLTLKDINVVANVAIGRNTASGFGLAVELKIHLPELTREAAIKLVDAADKICPYSNAIRHNVPVKLQVVDAL